MHFIHYKKFHPRVDNAHHHTVTALLLWVCLPSCAQVWGVDKTSGQSDVGIDYRAQIKRLPIGSGTPSSVELSKSSATYIIDVEGRPVEFPASLENPDTFIANLPPIGKPILQLTVVDERSTDPAFLRQWDVISTPNTIGLFNTFDHLDPLPAPGSAALDWNIALDRPIVAGDYFRWQSMGSWTFRGFDEFLVAGAGAIDPPPIPFATATTNNRRLTAINSSDFLAAARYTGGQLTGIAEAMPFTMADGPNPVNVTMVPVALDRNVSFTWDPPAVVQRLMTAKPTATVVNGTSWTISAAPAAKYANASGVQLQGELGTTPGTVQLTYGNPFVAKDWDSVFSYASTVTRVVVPFDGTTVSLGSVLLSAQAPPANQVLEHLQPLVTVVKIADVLLDIDGKSISIDRTQSTEVNFVTDRPAGSFYQLQLFEFEPPVNGNVKSVLKFEAVGATTKFSVPNKMLEDNKVYFLKALGFDGGLPNVLSGDLATRSLPIGIGISDSGFFKVMP
jgi:hypothetical protein